MTGLDEYGRTALHYAVRDGDLTAVNRRLDTEDVTLTDHSRWTPLHFVAQAGVPKVVTRLLDAGADLDALTEKGHPAPYWAAVTSMASPAGTTRVLRARGTDPTRNTTIDRYGRFPAKSVLDILTAPDRRRGPEIFAEFPDVINE
ncbi:ankyrin repeat domain-containing protein [Nocardia wallacei]|uniref:ankyrin repeat domain-containing protein n=1 Tax=Nocardia wallacei TaxID=480035 RepID=UPI0024552972|nr:ankyrin repeat domain-containing protein [Nocardia wallacei]